MIVIVGRTHLEEHEIVQLQHAIGNRITVLEKARKANEAADLSTREADDDIATCTHLKKLFSPVGYTAEEARRSQTDMFTGRPSQPIDEATRDAEREAARRIRHRELVRAIAGIMAPAPPAEEIGAGWTNEEVREHILEQFDDVEHVDQDGEKGEKHWPGIYRHETEDGKIVWCAVDTTGGVERFWYDIDAELVKFDREAIAATLVGEALVPVLREAWGMPDPEAAAERRQAEVRHALRQVLPGEMPPVTPEGDQSWEDAFADAVAQHIDQSLEGADGGDVPSGFFLPTPLEGDGVYCYARGGASIALWYDADPETFDPESPGRTPDLDEEAVLAIAREVLLAPAASSNDVENEEVTAETPAEWSKRIRPSPAPANSITTEMVVQALHSVLVLDVEGAAAGWHEFRQQPRTDAELLERAQDYLLVRSKGKNTTAFTETIGIASSDNVQFVPVEITIDPLRVVVGKGKKRQTLDTDDALTLIRALFEVERPEEAPEAAAVAAGAVDDDALPF